MPKHQTQYLPVNIQFVQSPEDGSRDKCSGNNSRHNTKMLHNDAW